MSWEQPMATLTDGTMVLARVEGADACLWCGGTGHYNCKALQFETRPDHDGEHRDMGGRLLAHRCGQCNGSGRAKVVAIR